jgi:Fungal trichothecene efflux pump (TRI12)
MLLIWYHPPPRVNSVGLTKRQILMRIDYVGAVLSITGFVLFLVGLNWGGGT